MVRIRTVKPELFKHEDLFELEKTYQLPIRLAFIGLFGCCDREGRFRWRPRQLKLDILPYDDINMDTILNALASNGFIIKYIVDGQIYGCIPSWKKHQHINTREPESILPALTDGGIIIISPSLVDTNDTKSAGNTAVTMLCPCMHMQSNVIHRQTSEIHNNLPVTENNLRSADQLLELTAEVLQAAIAIPGHEKQITQNTEQTLKSSHLEAISVNENLSTLDPGSCVHVHAPAIQAHAQGEKERKGNGRGKEGNEEREEDCQGEGRTNSQSSAPAHFVASQMRPPDEQPPIDLVFNHWKSVMGHPHANLDHDRKKAIRKALKSGYTPAQLCDAISGCALTPHNMGVNDRQQRYDGLQLILRDADQIDRFIHNFQNPPKHTAEKSPEQAMQGWVDKILTRDGENHETH